MKRILSILVALLVVQIHCRQEQTNGTQSYFISPAALAETPQISVALNKINKKLMVSQTTCKQSQITYIIDNVTITSSSNPNSQTVQISKFDSIKIIGARIEFAYRFNYIKIQGQSKVNGYAEGFVLSDKFGYSKELSFCNGFLCWRITPGQCTNNIDFHQNRMEIKFMEPFNQIDLNNLQNMLNDKTTDIFPSNIKTQILTTFNQLFCKTLNSSINQQLILNQIISYSFNSSTHGQMKINFYHKFYYFGLSPDDGHSNVYVTQIQNYKKPFCNITVPYRPFPFQSYGDTQSFHLNCLYQGVVVYLHSKGWLDVALNNNWQSDQFQFYAENLFDLVNGLNMSFSPRATLTAGCIAQQKGLSFTASNKIFENSYVLDITYNCSIEATSLKKNNIEILKFVSTNKIYVQVEATSHSLKFTIVDADMVALNFEPVGDYYVNNIDLAMLKVNSVIQTVINSETFGTGFPILTQKSPKTLLTENYVLYYDEPKESKNNLSTS